MSTNCSINVYSHSGMVWSIYCHYDGYPSHAGRILNRYYTDDEPINALIDLGDLSILAESPYEPPEGHSFDEPVEGFCVAYNRDRGETKNTIAKLITLDRARNRCEYNYFYCEEASQWYVCKEGKAVYNMKGEQVYEFDEFVRVLKSEYGMTESSKYSASIVKESIVDIKVTPGK